jgi:hypothetical protein
MLDFAGSTGLPFAPLRRPARPPVVVDVRRPAWVGSSVAVRVVSCHSPVPLMPRVPTPTACEE